MISSLPRWPVPTVVWKNIFVVIDDGTHSAPAYDATEKELAKHAAMFPKRVGCLVIIPPGAPQPSEEARTAVNRLLDKYAESFVGLAWVIEGKGFGSSLARATLMTMSLARRRPHASRVTGNLEEGLSWLIARQMTITGISLQAGLDAIAAARSAAAKPVTRTRPRVAKSGQSDWPSP